MFAFLNVALAGSRDYIYTLQRFINLSRLAGNEIGHMNI